ncbi:MAG: tetratricopeptide repeat protein [Planctomycetes bacterium]|nr:tetratricopeptide repeat protein [Planctomycetota bacterium]
MFVLCGCGFAALGIQWVYSACLEHLGRVLFHQGQRSEARAYLRRAVEQFQHRLEIEPDGRAHSDFAAFLIICIDPELRDPVEALRLATRAVELAPEASNHWMYLGWAHFRNGNWLAARQVMKKGLELKGQGNAWEYLLLAMIHWKLGEKDRAKDYYDQGVQWMSQKNRNRHSYTLRQLRAEADEVLGIKEPPQSKRVPPPKKVP